MEPQIPAPEIDDVSVDKSVGYATSRHRDDINGLGVSNKIDGEHPTETHVRHGAVLGTERVEYF